MNESKIIIIIGLITLTLLGGVVFLASRLSNSAKVEASADAAALVESTSYDWGNIGINNGKVDAVFEIKSTGKQDLKLFNGSTSCACTSAVITVGDKSSPLIGMHTQSDYVATVPQGKTALLKVTFDPLFHGPNGFGPINREATLSTNDPNHPQLKFFLNANVIK